jgi:hypothetical protein
MYFCHKIKEASDTSNGIWALAKWVVKKSTQPRQLPQFPTLKEGGVEITTQKGKTEALRKAFFPDPPEADLSDTQDATYPRELPSPRLISEEELGKIIRSLKPLKAHGPIKINALQQSLQEMLSRFTHIFNACVQFGYHPIAFKTATTIDSTAKTPER